MPSRNYIRWRDPVLWPGLREAVPAGYEVVTDRATADAVAEDTFTRLSPVRRSRYRTLWKTALDTGLQPSGLLLMRIHTLASAVSLKSKTVPGQWYKHLTMHNVLLYVPGQLYPVGSHPGNIRTRCYLILQPVSASKGR